MTNKLDPKILALNMHLVDAILDDCIALGERARIVRAALSGETKHVEPPTVDQRAGEQAQRQQAAYVENALMYGAQVIEFGSQNATAQAVEDRHTVRGWVEGGTI